MAAEQGVDISKVAESGKNTTHQGSTPISKPRVKYLTVKIYSIDSRKSEGAIVKGFFVPLQHSFGVICCCSDAAIVY